MNHYWKSHWYDETVTVGITDHAAIRMTQRRISKEAIAVVLRYGRQVMLKMPSYILSVRMSKRHLSLGQHAGRWEKFRDIHVIVSAENNAIITCYKIVKFYQGRILKVCGWLVLPLTTASHPNPHHTLKFGRCEVRAVHRAKRASCF